MSESFRTCTHCLLYKQNILWMDNEPPPQILHVLITQPRVHWRDQPQRGISVQQGRRRSRFRLSSRSSRCGRPQRRFCSWFSCKKSWDKFRLWVKRNTFRNPSLFLERFSIFRWRRFLKVSGWSTSKPLSLKSRPKWTGTQIRSLASVAKIRTSLKFIFEVMRRYEKKYINIASRVARLLPGRDHLCDLDGLA